MQKSSRCERRRRRAMSAWGLGPRSQMVLNILRGILSFIWDHYAWFLLNWNIEKTSINWSFVYQISVCGTAFSLRQCPASGLNFWTLTALLFLFGRWACIHSCQKQQNCQLTVQDQLVSRRINRRSSEACVRARQNIGRSCPLLISFWEKWYFEPVWGLNVQG